MKTNLSVKKYPQEGDLQHSYSPLKNILDEENKIVDFRTNEISVDLNNPLNLECQPSYDGTVNLIINDDKNPSRIINSRFTKIEDNRFRIVNRNQSEQTNIYRKGFIDVQTRLFRNISKIPKFDFVELNYHGQLKGGNYTFYVKYADSDYNKTDIVCESGQISVFKGNLFDITSISGTLQDELTDKSIKLLLTNIDESFSNIYLYYSREYSDTLGFRMSETVELLNPYEINGSTKEIIINGFEESELIAEDSLNIQYNYVTNVKTQAQVQNRLFFGNVENENIDVKNLQNLSYFFEVSLEQRTKSIGWIDSNSYQSASKDIVSLEYYDPKNIYYNLGYWPDEIYRLGVVYIMNDDSLSPVFNLRGCEFDEGEFSSSNLKDSKIIYREWDEKSKKWKINYLDRNVFLKSETKNLVNTFGVFKNPIQDKEHCILDHNSSQVRPWFYRIKMSQLESMKDGFKTQNDRLFYSELKKLGVKGFFFVRQKRIPTILCQGLSLAVDTNTGIPIVYDSNKKKYITEGFLNNNGKIVSDFESRLKESTVRTGSALLSVEAAVTPTLQSMLDGSPFLLQKIEGDGTIIRKTNDRKFRINFNNFITSTNRSAKCIFINENVPYKIINNYTFSTKAGNAESVKDFGFYGDTLDDQSVDGKYGKNNYNLVRGVYSPYIGVCTNLEDNAIYNIKVSNYSNQFMEEYFGIRRDDNSPFYAITDRFELDSFESTDVYRGDCFTNTVTVRLNRNFVDPDYPISDTIVDSDTWTSHYAGYLNTKINDEDSEEPDGNWAKINRGDLNAVPMGMWITYKCLANRNLGLRAEDHSYPDEEALMGNPRSFYPLQDASVKSSLKIAESWTLNDGYSSTVGKKMNILAPDIPYIKDQFDNRIMFSNIQVNGDFKNGYRVFQGLSYEDIDRQYGAIVKLIPWGVNLLCVFEHGIGVVPINEKALIQTTTEQSIHMYGTGVIQSQVSLITPDYGSIWPESIVRTPIGVYGVDTYAKKIWRYSDSKGFETISDMKIQRFLNDNIILREKDKYPIIGLKNVKSHYNNYKGDIMFTFYNFSEGKEWNFCFNERMDKWITRYSWTPLYSENINNIFYSLDKKRSEILAHIYDNQNCNYGIRTTINEWGKYTEENGVDIPDIFETFISLEGVTMASDFDIEFVSLTTSYLDKNDKEVFIEKDSDWMRKNISIENYGNLIKKLSWNKSAMESIFENEFTDYDIPLYYKLNVIVQPQIKGIEAVNTFTKTIGIVVNYHYNTDEYQKLLCNGFYVHGRAGVFDEIRYDNENQEDQIQPTKWYNKQEPFEFEFVVNEPVGLHKIFDNLVIISNKAKPNSIEIEVIGDVYNFKKSGLLKDTKFKNTTVKYDPILNQKTLVTEQECKDMEKVGRRMGNIHYKEDSWYLTVEPIKFKDNDDSPWSSARIRDKFAKVRVKYSGEDIVIITAIKTLLNLTNS